MASIYIIKHKDSDALYVGSTTDFTQRKYAHERRWCKENMKLYHFIRENGGWKRFDMWKIDCCDEENRFQKEQEYMDKFKPTLNANRAYGLDMDKKKETVRKYHENNKEQRKEYMKGYNKQYRIDHKDERNEYNKQYRIDNKDEIIEYKKQRREKYKNEYYECGCGKIVKWLKKWEHFNTQHHINYINSLPQKTP